MKRINKVVLALLLSVFCLASFAQPPVSPIKTKFGIKAGLNLSNISNSQDNIVFTPDMKPGFHAGAMVNIHFGKRREGFDPGTGYFGLQAELLFSHQGFIFYNEVFSFGYITLPVMAKCYITEGLNIEAGPYFSYLMMVSPNSMDLSEKEIKLSDAKGASDIGVGFGIGYELPLGLTVNARYNLGFSDLASNLAWRNTNITVSVGWLFGFSKKTIKE